ncbi:putative glycosyl transferase [Hyphomicrobium sulfonivorans]|uniref:Putative glycosyl transferase n=1 Tax=Hyphomicrobium sulfonivorans TaxID=121290 RepID=A0A109BK38_HYPSL|nr:undecaprenyl-phosphate glucose phosphotransferase [Hyphomicrobium sulfonivorans]KWT69437.1 putative glycosyl transferase [Hyphomicrobium sulfonivorans]
MSQIGNASVPNPLGLPTPEPRLADFRTDDNTSLVSMVVIRGVVRTLDVFIAAMVGLAVALFYVDDPEIFANPYYMAAIPFTAMVVALGFDMLGLYSRISFSSFLRQMPRVILIWTIAFALMLAAAFFLKAGHELSRVWLATWYASGLVLLLAERAAVTACVRHWIREGRLFRRAAIYGGSHISEKLITDLEKDVDSDIRIIGVFDDRGNKRIGSMTSGYPHLGSLKNLVSYARHSRLDMIIVALPITAEKRVLEITHSLAVLPAEVKLPAGSSSLRFTPNTYSHVGNVAMIDLLEKPIADWGAVSKWLFDKIVATLALIVLSPIMLAVAVAIKLDSRGPVLFRQKRYGFNNELIQVFKFRSMYTDRCDANASKLVTKDDPRVTRVGRFIRKTSLDELPQLFNVLIGNLSLVGPRPHALEAKAAGNLYDEVVDGYFARHKVKPGITGWAQINGWRGETDTPEKILKRVECDIYYIEHWSLLLDTYILLKTPFALMKSENAY